MLKRHVLPAAHREGITKKIGWHSFWRTLATLPQSSGASVKTTQELLRHSSPVMTLGPTLRADKRIAQDAIAALFRGKLSGLSTAQIEKRLMDLCGPSLGSKGPAFSI
jgi:integrase